MRRRLLLFALLASVALFGVLGASRGSAASPSRYVYWADGAKCAKGFCGNDGDIGWASLDGAGASPAFISVPGDPAGVAVDGNYIYWSYSVIGIDGATPLASYIGRANLDGTGVNQNFIAVGTRGVGGLAVDSNYVYWGAYNGPNSYGIGRANLDGTAVNQSFISLSGHTGHLAVDANYIYWTSSGGIGRANLAGTVVNPSFIVVSNGPRGVAVDSDYIYWGASNYPGFQGVGRANLDGTGVDQSYVAVSSPQTIAVDGNSVYWSEGGNGIGRVGLDGTCSNDGYVSGASRPVAIAVTAGESAPRIQNSVSYAGNGASGGKAPVDVSSPYECPTTVTVLDPGSLTKTGFRFTGWNTVFDGSGTAYQPGDTFPMPGTPVVLYARWSIASYAVTYDGNGATGGSVPIDSLSPYRYTSPVKVLAPGSLTKTGYTFSDWNTAADGSGTRYKPGWGFSMPASPVTLYAQWKTKLRPGTTTCNGIYEGTGSYVVVPSHATCTLLPGTHVTHSVTVKPGGTLHVKGVTISGKLTMSGSATVCGSKIVAGVVATGGSFALGDGNACGGNKIISGGILVKNDPNNVWIWNNTIKDGYGLTVNHGTGATDSIVGNTVSGKLLVEYSGPPVVVSSNHAANARCIGNKGQTGSGNVAAGTNTCPH